MAVPKEYGGLNYDALTQALVLEEWGYGCAGMGTTLAASVLSMDSVLVAGTTSRSAATSSQCSTPKSALSA